MSNSLIFCTKFWYDEYRRNNFMMVLWDIMGCITKECGGWTWVCLKNGGFMPQHSLLGRLDGEKMMIGWPRSVNLSSIRFTELRHVHLGEHMYGQFMVPSCFHYTEGLQEPWCSAIECDWTPILRINQHMQQNGRSGVVLFLSRYSCGCWVLPDQMLLVTAEHLETPCSNGLEEDLPVGNNTMVGLSMKGSWTVAIHSQFLSSVRIRWTISNDVLPWKWQIVFTEWVRRYTYIHTIIIYTYVLNKYIYIYIYILTLDIDLCMDTRKPFSPPSWNCSQTSPAPFVPSTRVTGSAPAQLLL